MSLAACLPVVKTPTAPESATPAAPATGQPKSGGTLRLGIVGGQTGALEMHAFAPSTSDYLWAMFDQLVSLDDKGAPQPQLAESFDISSDLKQFKFTLRKGVQFPSGREMTSADVKFNVLRPADPAVTQVHFKNFAESWTAKSPIGGPGTIETPDKYTIILKAEQPRIGVLDLVDRLNIADPEMFPGSVAPNTKAVGTGPFTMAEYVPSDHMNLVKNKNYWQSGLPYLDGINITFFNDPQTMMVALESGNLDYAMNAPGRDIVRLSTNNSYTHLSNKATGLWYHFDQNVTKGPTANKLVRQAINLAMDRQRWIDTEHGGLGVPRTLMFAPSSLGYDAGRSNFYAFDLDKADALFKQSGLSNIEFDFNYNATANPELGSLGQIMQSDLAKIGVKMNVKPMESAALAAIASPTAHEFGVTATGGCCTAMREPVVYQFISTYLRPNGNAEGYTSPRYTQLVDAETTEPDEAKRKDLYRQMNDLMLDEAFSLGIMGRFQDHLTSAKVHGARYTMHESVDFRGVWME